MLAEVKWQKHLQKNTDKTIFTASSAGNKPADKVNSTVVEVMKEKGIDISQTKAKINYFSNG